MKLIIKLLGILILLLGISLLIKPEIIFSWMENNMENSLLYIFAIVFRLGFGIILIIAAKESKYPGIINLFGFLAVIAAIIFIFMGQKSFQGFVSSLVPHIEPYTAVIGVVGMTIGSFLFYAFWKNKELKNVT